MATGSPRSFHKKYSFIVEFTDPSTGEYDRAEFQTCSELSAELAIIEHYEGGRMRPYKEPGRITYADITLERGATNDAALYDWHKQIVNSTANAGNPLPQFCRNVHIIQLERNGDTIRQWDLFGAWPTKFVAGEWDNNSDDNVIESITLTYDYFILNDAARQLLKPGVPGKLTP